MDLAQIVWTLPLLCAAFALSSLLYQTYKVSAKRYHALNTPLPLELHDTFKSKKTVDLSSTSPDVIQGEDILCYSPISGQIFGHCKVFSKNDVDQAIQRASIAQKRWASTTTYKDRSDLLQLLLNFVISHQEDICRASRMDTGKTMIDGALGEILTTCEKLRWTMKYGESVLAPDYRSSGVLLAYKHAWVEYHPLGVIGALVSWNYPFHNVFGPMISALFAGNAFVVKVSEHCSFSSVHYFQQIIHDALLAIHQPTDLVQFITGGPATGDALVRSPMIQKIVFIGSPTVGRLIMRNASDQLTPVVLELGGKDAAVLLEDADLHQVIPMLMRGVFQNSGQNCVGIERIVVHSAIYDTVVEKLSREVQLLTCSPSSESTDCGALTMGQRQKDHIVSFITDAVAQGARLLVDGRQTVNQHSGAFGAHTLAPSLLVDVEPTMKIAQNEVFGPVMVVMRAKDDADAVRLVNACPYGLGSAVFGCDTRRALSVARQLYVGMCNINDFAVNYLCQSLPFGGVKISGFDRFAGEEGLRGCCRMVSMTSDRFSFIKTHLPHAMQYPMRTDMAWQFSKSLIHLIYDSNWLSKGKALLTMASGGREASSDVLKSGKVKNGTVKSNSVKGKMK